MKYFEALMVERYRESIETMTYAIADLDTLIAATPRSHWIELYRLKRLRADLKYMVKTLESQIVSRS